MDSLKDHAKIGAIVGGALGLLASVRLITHGPEFFRDRIGLPYLAVLALYIVGGVFTCLMLDILSHFAKSLLSYIIVGVLVAFPASALFVLVLAKPEHSLGTVTLAAALMAVIYGTIGGIMAWRD
ncbi:MAG TPA: hypothetical protein VHH32_13630 [Gemmatimonadales bacterium]|nr:hypothetical protein [Gemmatimonadales bacterium]